MSILADFGTWHIEYHVISGTSPLVAGANEVVAFTGINRPGRLLGYSVSPYHNAAATSSVTAIARHTDNSRLAYGDIINNGGTVAQTIEIVLRNLSAVDATFPEAHLILFIRDARG